VRNWSQTRASATRENQALHTDYRLGETTTRNPQ